MTVGARGANVPERPHAGRRRERETSSAFMHRVDTPHSLATYSVRRIADDYIIDADVHRGKRRLPDEVGERAALLPAGDMAR